MSEGNAIPLELRLRPDALRTLKHAGVAGNHAWLLSGDDPSGLSAAARWIATRVLCAAGGGDDCSVCRRVARGVHPDLHVVEPEGSALAIHQIHELVEQLVRRPFEAAAQVAIIVGADSLDATNAPAGNALLKILEEPPGPVVFVLLAQRAARVLPTLRSRVVEVAFPPLSAAALTAALEGDGGDLPAVQTSGWDLQQLVRISRGEYSRAVEVVTGGAAAVRRGVVLPAVAGLCGATIEPADAAGVLLHRCEAVAQAQEAAATAEFEQLIEGMPEKDGKRFRKSTEADGMGPRIKRRVRGATNLELRCMLDEMAVWYRDLLAVRAGVPDVVVNADYLQTLQGLAATPAAERAVAALDTVEEYQLRVLSNADMTVALTAMCAELASLAEGRIRSRRTIGALSRTTQNYELAVH